MSTTGPIPKRSEERRRRNARTEAGESTKVERLEVDADAVEPPEVPEYEEWHAIAQGLWDAAQGSLFVRFYEPTDWAVLRMACESISRDLKPQVISVTELSEGEVHVERGEIPIKGASLTAYSKILASLLFTDGDRRRLRLEAERRNAVNEIAKDLEEVVADRNSIFQVLPGGKSAG